MGVDGRCGAEGVPDERGVLDPEVAQESAEVVVVSPRPIGGATARGPATS